MFTTAVNDVAVIPGMTGDLGSVVTWMPWAVAVIVHWRRMFRRVLRLLVRAMCLLGLGLDAAASASWCIRCSGPSSMHRRDWWYVV